MATQPRNFDLSYYYHVYNCGVEKRNIFTTNYDYMRFFNTIIYYLHDQNISFIQYKNLSKEVQKAWFKLNPKGLKTLRVSIISYCLMPNHFHFLLKLVKENGITQFLADLTNSYTRYFNVKYDRIGSLFQGTFKAKSIISDESLLEVTRYIHLNPVVSNKINSKQILKPENYPFSSYRFWISNSALDPKGLELLNYREVQDWIAYAGGRKKYQRFVESKIGREPKIGIEDLILE